MGKQGSAKLRNTERICGRQWGPCWIALLAIFLLWGTRSFAQPKAFASFSSPNVETGDTFQLSVLVSGARFKPIRSDLAPWSDFIPAPNILSKTNWQRIGGNWVQRFTLISFDSARLELPPLNVYFAEGNPITTNALQMNVFPTRGEEIRDMAPVRDIYREELIWFDYWPWGAGGAALIIVIAYVSRRFRKKPVPQPMTIVTAPVQTSPAEIAIQKLRGLEERELWKHDQMKEHYAELSLILREYLERSFHIPALESTTIEIMNMLANQTVPRTDPKQWRDLLLKADLVKYALNYPDPSQHGKVLVIARNLIAPENHPSKAAANPGNKPQNKGHYKPL